MYLAIGASELTSANAVELFTSKDCIFSEPLDANARLPNCKNCHLFRPVYPPDLDSSIKDKSSLSTRNNLVAPPAKINTSLSSLAAKQLFRFSEAAPE